MIDSNYESPYKQLSAKENNMAEKITVVATPSETIVTRLVAGVELALRQSGKHWMLSVSKS